MFEFSALELAYKRCNKSKAIYPLICIIYGYFRCCGEIERALERVR